MNKKPHKKLKRAVVLALGLTGVMACIPAPSVTATPLPRTIAPVTAEVPISAGSGWLLWSVPVGNAWGLDA